MLLMIDNYDSFTWMLVQYFRELGEEVVVRRNDEIDVDGVLALGPDRLCISPGPSNPDRAGVSRDAIGALAGTVPVLGVCLGHQCIASLYGHPVVRARRAVHGKTSVIRHDGRSLFARMPERFTVTRYHSLIVEDDGLPECLEVTAWTEGPDGGRGEVMGLRHRDLPIEGVQFHPESVVTEHGHDMLRNWLAQGSVH